MIVVGWGDKGVTLGVSALVECQHCRNVGAFKVIEQTKRVSVFWVPIVKWNRRYVVACPVCSNGYELANKEAALAVIAEGLGGIRPS